MSDPAEAAPPPEAVAGWAGLVTVVIGAIAGLWRTVFGTRKERIDANERAAELALRAAEHSEERAERADEETASHKMALGTCEEQLRAVRTRIARLEREHSTCGPRIAALEKQVHRLTLQSTPPHGMYTGEDVLAAMQRHQEETGP